MKEEYPFGGQSVVNEKINCYSSPIEVINQDRLKTMAAEQFTPSNLDKVQDYVAGMEDPNIDNLKDMKELDGLDEKEMSEIEKILKQFTKD